MVAHQSIIKFMLEALTHGQPAAVQHSLKPWEWFANCEMRSHTFVGTSWQEDIDNQIHKLTQGKEE